MVLLKLERKERLIISGEDRGQPSDRFIYIASYQCQACSNNIVVEVNTLETDAIKRLRKKVYNHQCPEVGS
jgi:hypothetical protein